MVIIVLLYSKFFQIILLAYAMGFVSASRSGAYNVLDANGVIDAYFA